MHLDGGAWDWPDAKNFQGVPGGGLLALFDGTAGAGGNFLSLNGDPGGEARPMCRSLFGDDAVYRPQPVGLQRLLQKRLPVTQLVGVDLGGVEDLVQYTEDQGPV